ncbi:MAG: PaaI family thioesterase [Dehalococcoidia bacterium]
MGTPIDPALLAWVAPEETPFWRHLGIRFVEAESGRAVVSMPHRPEFGTVNRPDVVHGGAIATLIDAAAGTAVRTLRTSDEPAWRGMSTTDLNVSYLDAAASDLTAEGRVLRSGRTIAWAQVDVRDADGTLVAVGRVTAAIRRG